MFLDISIVLVTIALVVVCLFMILLVLMQRPKQEGLGAAFGAGVTDQIWGSQTTNVLQKGTTYLGVMLFVLSLSLAMLKSAKNRENTGLKLADEQPAATTPVIPPAPATTTSTPVSIPTPGAANTTPITITPATTPAVPAPAAEGAPAETPVTPAETPVVPAEPPAVPAAPSETPVPAPPTETPAPGDTPATPPADPATPGTPQ